MLIFLKARTISYADQVLYSLEDGLVSVTKVDNVHPYSNVNRILLLRNSNLSRSPSTPRHLLILPGLLKHAPFNQPIRQGPWLLALQQRLSQYPFERPQVLTVPLPVRQLVEDGLGGYGSFSANQGTRATATNYIGTGIGAH